MYSYFVYYIIYVKTKNRLDIILFQNKFEVSLVIDIYLKLNIMW